MKEPEKIIWANPPTCPPERRGWLSDVADICNSELGQGIGVALMILTFTLGIGGCIYLEKKGEAEVKQAIKE